MQYVINVRTSKQIITRKQERKTTSQAPFIRPTWILPLIEDIKALKKDTDHQERAHESLVETFYELLGSRNLKI